LCDFEKKGCLGEKAISLGVGGGLGKNDYILKLFP